MTGQRDRAFRIDPRELVHCAHCRAGLTELINRLGRSEQLLISEAHDICTSCAQPRALGVRDLPVKVGRVLCDSGYARIDYEATQVKRVRDVLRQYAAVVLSSHRSYLDGGAIMAGFHDHRLPSLIVLAGINMAFWPTGAIWRRADNVFIRRGAASPVSKYPLRHFLAHLVEQCRHLQWFIEGTRFRTGKLGPPRLGLLVYVVEAYREGRTDDLVLVPVSITYDQLREVEEYAGEARGVARKAETLTQADPLRAGSVRPRRYNLCALRRACVST